jgi:hypothetical protein
MLTRFNLQKQIVHWGKAMMSGFKVKPAQHPEGQNLTSPYSCALNAPRRMSSTTCQMKLAFSEKLFVMQWMSLDRVMNWEIIVLIMGEKANLQPIQYADQKGSIRIHSSY